MRLNGVQAQALFQIAIDSLRIASELGGLSVDARNKIVNQILNQQGQDVVDTTSWQAGDANGQ